jgi:hypothetical protein
MNLRLPCNTRGLLEWRVAGVVMAGHMLVDQHRFASLRGLGEAAEAA